MGWVGRCPVIESGGHTIRGQIVRQKVTLSLFSLVEQLIPPFDRTTRLPSHGTAFCQDAIELCGSEGVEIKLRMLKITHSRDSKHIRWSADIVPLSVSGCG